MLTLLIGNKNYSSWSVRPWVLLRQLGIAFEERRLWLCTDEFAREVARVSPAGRVPVLIDDGFAVWDSLAITEYVHERFPHAGVWPADARRRARARSVCAEMHGGFTALRTQLPMNVEASIAGVLPDEPTRADIARIAGMWTELRARHAHEGPFLFGAFCAADAFYAPVASRFRTYGVMLPDAAAAYAQALLGCEAMCEWTAGALAEQRFVAEDEPYRTSR